MLLSNREALGIKRETFGLFDPKTRPAVVHLWFRGLNYYVRVYLDNNLLGWFSALRPPYIGSGAAVRAVGVRTPRSDAARPRLCASVCVSVNWWGEERTEAEEISTGGSPLNGTPRK